MSEANNLASEASLAKFGAKRQFFASISKNLSQMYALSFFNQSSGLDVTGMCATNLSVDLSVCLSLIYQNV